MNKETHPKPRYRIEFLTTIQMMIRYSGSYDAYFKRFKEKYHIVYNGNTKRYQFITKVS